MRRLRGPRKFLRGQMALRFRWVILGRCTIRLIMATIAGEKVSTGCDMMSGSAYVTKPMRCFGEALTYRIHSLIMGLARALDRS